MDVQDHTIHSGHEGHGVHLCHRCGWPFPNPHPSAKHRRAHKKVCGTIEGYTNLISSEVVSDDEHEHEHHDDDEHEHHHDDDKEKTPSPKVEIKESVSRSEDEFKDAVTEFVDTGSANKSLDRDLFFSFKDAESAGTNEVLNATTPVEINKVDTNIEVSEKANPHVEKTEETEIKTVSDSSKSNLELTPPADLVKDGVVGPNPEPSHVSESQEANSVEVMEAGEGKGQESQTSEPVIEEAKDSDITKTTPELVSEVVKESESVKEIKQENCESDHTHVPEFSKESELDQNVPVVNEKVDLDVSNEQIQEVVNEPVADLTEKKDLDEPELEKKDLEQIQEAVKEPVAVLIEKEDLGGPQLEKQSIEHTHEVVEKIDTIVTEKDLCAPELEGSSKEQIQEDVKEPVAVLVEKEDLGGPHLEKQTNEHTQDVVEEPVKEPDSVLTEKEDLGAHKSETCSNGEVIEQKVTNNLVADVSTETVTLNDVSGPTVTNSKDAGADLIVDSSSQNSLEETLGTVSVLSTTSIDAETLQSTEKSKVNSEKSNAATSDVFEPPSFMTLVEPETKDNKSDSPKLQDSQPPPNSEASQAGWFPTLTEVNKESEGRKKNEEAMAKVTNLTTGKQSTPLMNLLGEARSPSGKQLEPVVQKEEAVVNPSVNDDVTSPPKLIEDGKKGRKKAKGISSWVPFACCSSVNAVK